jgi:hypothetical protein
VIPSFPLRILKDPQSGKLEAHPCDADDLLFGAVQADGHLMFDGYAAEELGVEAEAVGIAAG